MAHDMKKEGTKKPGNEENYNITAHRERFEVFLNVTQEERIRAEKRRDYRDLKQWTAKEIATLQGRKQAPIVFDQFSQKVDSIVGLEIQGRSDPKALPVHPKHEKAAEVITDALRFVESRTYLDETFSECFEDKLVEGVGGIITEVEKAPKGGEYRINTNRIPWDRIYYDPYSRSKDFGDSAVKGITLWMDVDDAVALNPKKEEEIKAIVDNSRFDDETYSDRPNYWSDSKRKRLRINQEYYLEKGKWMVVYYSGDTIVIEPKESDYKDEDGLPMYPLDRDWETTIHLPFSR